MPTKLLAFAFSLLILFAAQISVAAERNMIVFISDLHMNVDSNYSWLVAHAGDVAQFLNDVNARDDVAELVILGDLVDHWVAPVEDAPHSFSDVLSAVTNKDIVKTLQALCSNQNIKVTYVVGNHDMLSFQTENKDQIYAKFPRHNINIISDSPGMGAYDRDNVIWAEHEHRYTMFNAPDTWSHADSHLPLGYFVSRLGATKSARSGQVITTPDVLRTFVNSAAANCLNDYLENYYPFTPRIILFGHTHEAAFQAQSGEVKTIYVNTGTWIDGKPMTWAEIEVADGDDGDKLYTVSL